MNYICKSSTHRQQGSVPRSHRVRLREVTVRTAEATDAIAAAVETAGSTSVQKALVPACGDDEQWPWTSAVFSRSPTVEESVLVSDVDAAVRLLRDQFATGDVPPVKGVPVGTARPGGGRSAGRAGGRG